jgi:D-arabinose 1-dehydrogenase-like Zn-dependent alcohol dehydrogenase
MAGYPVSRGLLLESNAYTLNEWTIYEVNTMKAICFEEFGTRDALQFGDRPEPTPDRNELLIEVERSSVNFVDIRERQGTYNRPETHVGGIELPHVSGLQAVGRVVEAGSEEEQTVHLQFQIMQKVRRNRTKHYRTVCPCACRGTIARRPRSDRSGKLFKGCK